MADTFSPNLRIRLPETGQYNNTWGTTLNSDALTLFDHAITGKKALNIGSSVAYSLAALTNGSASDSRYLSLQFTGTPAGLVTVTLPASVVNKLYLVDNQTGQPMLFTYTGSTNTVTVPNGQRVLIWCDASNVYPVGNTSVDAATLGGIAASNYARLDTGVTNVWLSRNRYPFNTVTDAPTITLDFGTTGFRNDIVTLGGNRAMAAPVNLADGLDKRLIVKQDGSGGHTLTWDAIFVHENASAPTLTSTPGQYDVFDMTYNAAENKVFVRHAFNLGVPGGVSAFTYNINENVTDWNLLAKVGSLGGSTTININIAQGVIVQASCTGTPAMDLMGLPAGSTINLVNNGYIIGKGGDGGDAGSWSSNLTYGATSNNWAKNGKIGGNAIKGPGTGRTLNITNGSGFIYGGGGGGGGGGFTPPAGVPTAAAAGGGGGGGAGGGKAGNGAGADDNGVSARGTDGTFGTTGPSGAAGIGGTPASAGSATGFAGGVGGGYGSDGVDGTGGVSSTHNNFGTKGTAGKAVDLQGGSAPFVSGSGSPHVLGAVS